MYVFLSQKILKEFREGAGIPKWAGPFDFDQSPRRMVAPLQRRLQDMVDLASAPIQDEVTLPTMLFTLGLQTLATLWEHHPSQLKERLKTIRYRINEDPRLDRALTKLYERYPNRLTTAALAEEAGMSESTLARLFQEQFKETPRFFLRRYRVDQAELLLGHHADRVEDIARQVGFGSAWALRRAYRAVRGRPLLI